MAKKRVTKKSRTVARRKAKTAKASPRRVKRAKPKMRKRAATKARGAKRTRPATVTNPLRELARRIVDLTIRQDDEGSYALYADNVESIEPGMPPTVGIDAIKQKFARWRSTVSDSSWQARKVCVDGNTILIEWTGRVTFAATGTRAELNEIAIHEVQNGKIVRERFYYDRAALQPAPATAGAEQSVQPAV